MNLTSLLVCSDDRALRVLCSVLGKLEIDVEHCADHVSAAKELAQRTFEAVQQQAVAEKAKQEAAQKKAAQQAAAEKAQQEAAQQHENPKYDGLSNPSSTLPTSSPTAELLTAFFPRVQWPNELDSIYDRPHHGSRVRNLDN